MFTWLMIQLGFIDKWVLTKIGTLDGDIAIYSIHLSVWHHEHHARFTVINQIREWMKDGWQLERGYIPNMEITNGR